MLVFSSPGEPCPTLFISLSFIFFVLPSLYTSPITFCHLRLVFFSSFLREQRSVLQPPLPPVPIVTRPILHFVEPSSCFAFVTLSYRLPRTRAGQRFAIVIALALIPCAATYPRSVRNQSRRRHGPRGV